MEPFIGNIFFERGEGSPLAYTRVCPIMSISGLGEVNELVDVTTFCSNGNREYIGGLSDGVEITVEGNYISGDASLAAMIQDVKDKTNQQYRIVNQDGSPEQVFSFEGTPLSWTLNPSVDDKNSISFTIKISGAVNIS